MSHPAQTPDKLKALARLHGVQTSYVDMAGRRRPASAQSLLAMLRTLGAPLENMAAVPEALRAMQQDFARRPTDPVHVLWGGTRTPIPLQLPGRAARGALSCEWRREDGGILRAETRLDRLPVRRVRRVGGERLVTVAVPVPRNLPVGYHRLAMECGSNRFETQVFCAPERCFQPASPGRHWGLFAPLYALHSGRSWGAGDLGDLADCITWVSQQGGRFLGTLPLLPAFLGTPCEPSPYSPVSRLFWNEFYLDLHRVPELQGCPTARRLMQSPFFLGRLQKLRAAPLVDYAAQMALKRQVLEAASRSFFTKRSGRTHEFEAFLRKHGHAADYARFRAVHEQRGEPWTKWPERMRQGELRDADCRPPVRQYHLYVQWLAHEQMSQLADEARRRNVDLYLDMPLGTHREGYDSWRYRDVFALDASGGAPPDPVFTQGQDWGFAPIHPQRSREQGHAYVRAYLRHHLRHARMLRFDHVMGLHRLYWVPAGLPAREGAYVSYPAEEFYAMLSIESHRHQAVIIGENLGTVPPAVNRALRRHGVGGMFVVQYEVRPPPRPALRRVPPDAVASVNTHDMPPFAAFWDGLDIADRRDLGLIRRADLPGERRLRERIRRSLLRFLRRQGGLARGETDPRSVGRALTYHLGASEARWLLVNLEDLWLETASQNTPGTSTERINWRRRMRFSLEQLSETKEWSGFFKNLRRVREQSRALGVSLRRFSGLDPSTTARRFDRMKGAAGEGSAPRPRSMQ